MPRRIEVKMRLFLSGTFALMMWQPAGAGYQQECAVLRELKNGETVRLRGEAVSTGHDLILRPEGCTDTRIILRYTRQRSSDGEALTVRDKAFEDFEKYLRARREPAKNRICPLCPQYRVYARFEGRLEVASHVGVRKDPKSGRVTAVDGFGHPAPFSRYRMTLIRVSEVEAIEIGAKPD